MARLIQHHHRLADDHRSAMDQQSILQSLALIRPIWPDTMVQQSSLDLLFPMYRWFFAGDGRHRRGCA